MIVVMQHQATPEDARRVLDTIADAGLEPLHLPGVERVVIGALGDERILATLGLDGLPGVERTTAILTPYKLVGRELHPHDTTVRLGKVTLGSDHFGVIAGPCAVESVEQTRAAAKAVAAAGAHVLRGGAFKPRSSPYSFQGHGHEAVDILVNAAHDVGLPCVTEVLDAADVEDVADKVDAVQIGARNMQNFTLLRAVGQLRVPVFLKRGMSATLEELLLSAEYIVTAGNEKVVLVERGIRTFEPAMRNTVDLAAVAHLKNVTHLPIVVDPSHGTGRRELIAPVSNAAAAIGADGVMIEVHPDPTTARSDGKQSLEPRQFEQVMSGLRSFVDAAGRVLP